MSYETGQTVYVRGKGWGKVTDCLHGVGYYVRTSADQSIPPNYYPASEVFDSPETAEAGQQPNPRRSLDQAVHEGAKLPW